MKAARIVLFMICISLLFSGCKAENDVVQNDEDNITIHTDTNFITEQFPELSGVEVARYYYEIIGDHSDRSIGPMPARFAGLIYLEKDALTDISNEYDWRECDVQPPKILSDGNTYSFFYSEEFDSIFSASFVGSFYFDRERGILFFEGEY
jgi:hypothetical protein